MLTNKPVCVRIQLERNKREREEKEMMTAEKMMDEVIKKNGFEAEVTLWFCEKAEQFINFELSATELVHFYQVAMR